MRLLYYVHPLFSDPELSRMLLHPQIQIPNAFPVLDNHFKFRILEHEGKLEFLAGGIELLWGKCRVFPGPVQGILVGGRLMKVYAPPVSVPGAQIWKNGEFAPK